MQVSYSMLKGVLVYFPMEEVEDAILFLEEVSKGFGQSKDTCDLGKKFHEMAEYVKKQHTACGNS